jgi:hypothetical protein
MCGFIGVASGRSCKSPPSFSHIFERPLVSFPRFEFCKRLRLLEREAFFLKQRVACKQNFVRNDSYLVQSARSCTDPLRRNMNGSAPDGSIFVAHLWLHLVVFRRIVTPTLDNRCFVCRQHISWAFSKTSENVHQLLWWLPTMIVRY